jgi:uncharacterized protein YndB with AHSA1/START domain
MPERELHLECVVSAPPERVFAACVDAEALAEWWGPTGFTSTVHGGLDGRTWDRTRERSQLCWPRAPQWHVAWANWVLA